MRNFHQHTTAIFLVLASLLASIDAFSVRKGLAQGSVPVTSAAFVVAPSTTTTTTTTTTSTRARFPTVLAGGCPFLAEVPAILPGYPPVEVLTAYEKALDQVDWGEIKSDLKQLFRDSKDWWPADYGHYGGLFIRLAWHCTGSYRMSDGRGGCDGGNQRFEPERSWDDNTNLDKARRLLEPIKLKHGLGLSWGDLFVLSGTMAIEDMGGPVLGFCGGRIDHIDNSQTRSLGPTPEQDQFSPCEVDGDCQEPLGQNTLGLIYVNPEGPMGVPDPQGAADTIRDVFGRMDMDDRENVALIGGGHTFGKCHGASTDDPGPKPFENEANPWPGNFGSGRGMDTVTSGFEGAWTDNPIQWDNSYFTNLLNYEWESWKGPGGHYQWRVKGQGPKGPVAYPPNSKDKQDIMMLTTDIGLITDPEYRKYVEEFANDPSAFAEAFAAVWYKLVNRDMGPATRCVGPDVAPPQAFQFPLPDPPAKLADFDAVEKDLGKLKDGEFIRLAMQSANTYRCTDYLGGCNGARIRFSPGKDWKTNVGLDKTLAVLEPIKKQYGDSLSWADLIVLAGNVAVKHMGAPSNIPFCPGRTDAPDGAGWKPLEFGNAEFPSSVADMVERYERRGLTAKEFVALSFANSLAPVAWLQEILSSEGVHDDVMAEGFKFHPDLRIWAEYYLATGHEVFANDFATVWTKLMNSDRFDGPTGNVCIVSP